MTTTPNDPYDSGRVAAAQDDASFVPGLGPAPTDVPAPRAEQPGRLDPALDPDRYDVARDAAPAGPLDPSLDPDRYDPARAVPPGQGQTLPELLGDGAHEDPRNNYQWAIGLLGVLAFLALVSFFFSAVVSA